MAESKNIEGDLSGRSIEEEQRLRTKAVGLGLNPDNVMFGCVIEYVQGDDLNAFTNAYGDFFTPERAHISRETLSERFNWETHQPIPDELKQRIEETRKKLAEYDWESKDGFNGAYNYWKTNLRDWLINKTREEEKKPDSVYQKALREYETVYYGAPSTVVKPV